LAEFSAAASVAEKGSTPAQNRMNTLREEGGNEGGKNMEMGLIGRTNRRRGRAAESEAGKPFGSRIRAGMRANGDQTRAVGARAGNAVRRTAWRSGIHVGGCRSAAKQGAGASSRGSSARAAFRQSRQNSTLS